MEYMRILICCSDLTYKGGMVSVVKGYLGYDRWPDDIKLTFVPTHREGGKGALVWCFAKALARILRMARRGEIDVAHLHVAERGSFVRKAILMRILHRYGIPVVLHHHGAEFEPWYAARSPRVRHMIDNLLAEADLNIVLSRRLVRSITHKALGADVLPLYNAVEVAQINPYTDKGRGVLFLGRLGRRKGTYDLLEAIRRIDSDIPADIHFYLCGDGEVDQVRQQIKAMGIGHRIAHIGWTDGTLKETILADTMLNVLPSYHEGLPMTILETMARGIPNISTPVASIPEVITDGETGLLVEPGDVDALADALRRLIGDTTLRCTISVASHNLILRRFSLATAIDTLTGIYRRLKTQSPDDI